MDDNGISLIDSADILDWDPEELSNQALADLFDITQITKHEEESSHQTKAANWFYRMPFAGVRYYSYE